MTLDKARKQLTKFNSEGRMHAMLTEVEDDNQLSENIIMPTPVRRRPTMADSDDDEDYGLNQDVEATSPDDPVDTSDIEDVGKRFDEEMDLILDNNRFTLTRSSPLPPAAAPRLEPPVLHVILPTHLADSLCEIQCALENALALEDRPLNKRILFLINSAPPRRSLRPPMVQPPIIEPSEMRPVLDDGGLRRLTAQLTKGIMLFGKHEPSRRKLLTIGTDGLTEDIVMQCWFESHKTSDSLLKSLLKTMKVYNKYATLYKLADVKLDY